MVFSALSRLYSKSWFPVVIVLATSVVAFAVIIFSLEKGITIVVPHLLYVPIILAAFFYPRKGVFFAAAVALVYFSLVAVIRPGYPMDLVSAFARCIVFLVIAAVVSYLTNKLNWEKAQANRVKDEWELTFNAVPDLIAIIDRDFHIIRINRAMAAQLGISPSQASGSLCYEVVHHSKTPPIICPHAMLLKDGNEHSSEIHENVLGGDYLVTVSPYKDAQGQVIGSVHVARDITERKLVERALQDSERKYRQLVELAREGIWAIDADSRTTYVNPRMAEMLGYTVEEMLGKPLFSFMDKDGIRIAEENIERRKRGINEQHDFEFLRKDGKKIYTSLETAPLTDDSGTYTGALAVVADISGRRVMEQALRESTERARALIDSSPDIVVLIDPDGKILDLNEKAVTHFVSTNENLTGKNIVDYFLAENRAKRRDAIASVVNTKTPLHFEDWRGNTYLSWDIHPIMDDGGNVRSIALFLRNITERQLLAEEMDYHNAELRRYSEALTQANRKLNILSSITRHDILNKLTVLLGYQELSRDLITDPLLQGYLKKEHEATESIRHQIEFTRFYQNIGLQAPEWYEVRVLIHQAAGQLPLKKITLSVHCEEVLVYADPLIEKVFYNLLENAVRHGGTVTNISFSVREEGSGLVIIYEDNGIGIPGENKERIFERGFGEHTGLGLFLTREILAITGITIQETGEPGKGARFEITVPQGGYRFNHLVPGER